MKYYRINATLTAEPPIAGTITRGIRMMEPTMDM